MSQVIHKSLELPGYWRVLWFGKLTNLPKSGVHDLRIHVYLGQIQDPENQLVKGKLTGRTEVAYLPVGELPRLYLNAVLFNGKLVSQRFSKLEFEKEQNIALNTDKNNIKVFDRFEIDSLQEDYIVPLNSRTDPTDNNRNGLLLGIGSQGDQYSVIVPAVEVFRFFYATSNVITNSILSDRFLDPNTNLWSMANTAIDNQGRAVIWLRWRMLDSDARFLARFAFNDYALKEAQNIFLHAAAMGQGSSSERMIRALPPFQGRNNFKVLYKSINDNPRRILITRFVSCNWSPPFKELRWDRDNDGRKDPKNKEERSPSTWKPGQSVLQPTSDVPDALSIKAPSGFNNPSSLKEEEIAERFPNLGKVPALKLPQTDTKNKHEPKNWKLFFKKAYEGSVIEGQSSFEFVGKAIIESMESRNEALKSVTSEINACICEEKYLNILKLLLLIKDSEFADVSFLTVLESYSVVNDIEFNVYPYEIDGKKKAWLYVDSEKTQKRMALLASVSREESIRYVLELQQRIAEECSTIVFWGADGKQLSLGLLTMVVMSCAQSGRATLEAAQSMGVCWGRLHHTTKSNGQADAKHYLHRIYSTQNIAED